ncbi:MAG: S-layer protein, partial [Candidatus Methanofastidiosum sp.]|nr:S-layer protein [Methanofastidiosum sp.]
MRIKMLGAALTGALMLGATLAGAVAAQTVPPKSFFIDQITGEPDVVIAVGATANASDVVSASLIAAAVGNMATVEETKTVTRTASATFDYMMDYNYAYDRISKNIEYYTSTCANEAAWAKWYTDYELYSNQFWETASDTFPVNGKYDISVAIAMPREVRNLDGAVVARELNTLWFSNSPKDWDSNNRIYSITTTSGSGQSKYWLVNTKTTGTGAVTDNIVRETLPSFAGGSYDNGNGSWDFNTYNAFFTTKAWVAIGDDSSFGANCDYYFGGTGTEMEAHEEIQVILADIETTPDGLVDLRGDRGSASGIIYRTAEIRYPLLENGQNICGITKCDGMIDFETAVKGRLNEIKFLGKMYKPMFAGATYVSSEDLYLGAYFVYGKPYAEKEKIMKVGDAYSFHGWTINLSDVNIYENKAFITVSGPDLASPFSFIMVMDALDECRTLCCPGCAAYGGSGSFTSNPTKRYEYDPYIKTVTKTKEVDGRSYDLFKYTSFMLDGIKTFVGADGTYLAEFNLYAVEDFGWFEDKGCCDPFVTTPNDYGLAITGGWRK